MAFSNIAMQRLAFRSHRNKVLSHVFLAAFLSLINDLGNIIGLFTSQLDTELSTEVLYFEVHNQYLLVAFQEAVIEMGPQVCVMRK